MFSTGRNIALIAANFYLISNFNNMTVIIYALIHDGFSSAMANGFKLDEAICPSKQIKAAWKRLLPGNLYGCRKQVLADLIDLL
jgi:hypothetical protein